MISPDDFLGIEAEEDKHPLSVTQVTAQVRALLEERFSRVWVEGEISNWSVAGSGHAYFALKDESALLSCVMWRSALARSRNPFRDGDRVEARGRVSVFERRGQYQLIVDSLKPVGAGVLWQKFLELKARLEAEGLFDPERRRPIPRLPHSVGVVTSPSGAAIRDILSILRRRAPGLPIYIWPARVQGAGAAEEITEGVRELAASGLADVIIVGRGGGSLEDLWEFNNENLAREIVRSPVPIISAVGHETDFSISDFVADMRAPTPSAAAELVTADRAELCSRVEENLRRAARALEGNLEHARRRITGAVNSYALRHPERLLLDAQQRVDDLCRRMDLTVERSLGDARRRAVAANGALQGHDPALILKKGYAIVRRVKDGKLVTKAATVKPGTHIHAELTDGRVRAIAIEDVADLFENS